MFKRLDAAIFYVKDIEKSKLFYSKILGFKLIEDQGKYVTFQIGDEGGSLLALNSQHRPFQVIGKQTINVKCTDIDNLYQKLIKEDLKIFDELKDRPWGRYFAFEDIDGNHIDVTEE